MSYGYAKFVLVTMHRTNFNVAVTQYVLALSTDIVGRWMAVDVVCM